MEGWQVASKGLVPLPRRRGSALARGCGKEGSGALPLPRAAAVWTGLSVRSAGSRSTMISCTCDMSLQPKKSSAEPE